MDILKVLSRGTKRTVRQSQLGAAASKSTLSNLPSAGTKTNPQLFHDDVRGQKRRRTEVEDGGEDADETELPEVDFFAPKNETAHEKSRPPRADRSPSPIRKPAQRLDEDECRQILRSHRLKMTLMTKPAPKKVKKSKKKAKPVLETNKAEHKQLFPQPLTSFAELRNAYDVPRAVAENLSAQGYKVPTEVQLGSLPLLLRPDVSVNEDGLEDGVDFLAIAPTGSGKTISFLIPAISGIMKRRQRAEGSDGTRNDWRGLEAVVVAPTRELAHQIVNEGRKILEGADIKIMAMRKGIRIATDTHHVEEGVNGEDGDDDDEGSESDDDKSKKTCLLVRPNILVTTPLLLLNHLQSGATGTDQTLPTVRELILDEADVLLDPLFRDQTLGIWTACTNPDLRASFWSATMGSNIESMVTEKLASRAKSLTIDPRPLVRLVVGLKDTAVPNIVHKLTYTASEQGKLLALRQLLHPTASDDSGPPLRPPFLVFTQTIDRAKALAEELKYDIPLEAGGSTRIAALHSDLPDSQRAAIMRKFRGGDIWIMITTDVLARGVDFAGVNGVVNYDVPGSSAAYVHRAGRTGRAGREGGVAVTFYTKDDIPFVKTVANVIAASEKQAGKTGDEASVQKWLLDALPKVSKADRKKVKGRGVESRRSGNKANITSRSGYERRKEQNRRGAIEGSKKRKKAGDARGVVEGDGSDGGGEWSGFGD